MLTEFDMEDTLIHATLISDIIDQSQYIIKDFAYESSKVLVSWYGLCFLLYLQISNAPH